MSHRSYGSGYSSSFRRPGASSLSSSLYSPTFSPLLYRPSTYSSLSSTYRRPSYGSSGALNTRCRHEASTENLSSNKYSTTVRPLPRPEPDSPPTLRKTSFSRSLGNLSTFDNNNASEDGLSRMSGNDAVELNYKKLYVEETSQRELDQMALVAELQDQMDLRQKLINLINELEGLQDDLDDTSEMCILLERLGTTQEENKRLEKQKLSRSQRANGVRKF